MTDRTASWATSPCQLLESHDEMDPVVSLLLALMIRKVEQQKSFDEVQFEEQAGVGRFRALDGDPQPLLILNTGLLAANIATVDREKR